MHVGAAEVVITPPLGVELAGYGPRRERRSTAIDRQLTAQALVFRQVSREAALVVCDVLTVTQELVAAVRAGVEASTGIPGSHVLVAATHSHSAPSTGGFSDFGRPDRAYVRMLARTLIGAVAWAQRRAEPSRVFVGRGAYEGLAWNRVGGPSVDHAVRTLHVANDAGVVTAVLGHYACHPVILGPSTVISPDFPGAFRDRIRDAYPQCVATFVNGACGDIDPITNRDVWGQGTVDDVRQHGERLAEAALAAMRNAVPINAPELDVVRSTMCLAYDVPSPEERQRRMAIHAAVKRRRGRRPDDPFGAPAAGEGSMPGFWLRYYRGLERRLQRGDLADHECVELQALRLGRDVVFLAIPAEVYAEHGLLIERESPYANTVSICYANGCCGYLPPEKEFREGHYTASLAAAAFDRPPFRSDVAQVMVDHVRELLRESRKRGAGQRGPEGQRSA